MLRRRTAAEQGFSLIELVVAVSIIATAFLGLTRATAGAIAGLHSVRQRSAFIELGNAEVESLRAQPFASLGVSSTDPDLTTAYPAGSHDGRTAVQLDVATLRAADPTFADPPPAVAVVTSSAVQGIRLPYTVRRWVTWSSAAGSGGATQLKRIDVTVEWSDTNGATRHVDLHSLRYPGGLGPISTNQQPTAVATATPTSGTASLVVAFSGSGSSDPDGTISSYAWQFGDGTTGVGATPSHTYTTSGTYSAILTVTDNGGLTNAATRTISVTAPAPTNLPPTASFTASPISGVAPLSVSVNGSASSDPENGPLTYLWSWGDGTAGSTATSATHVYSSATGSPFTVSLTVTDNGGLTSTATTQVTATPLNCSITSASFKNPGTNATANRIAVQNKNHTQASNATFVFTATSNLGCTTMNARLPWTGGTTSTAMTYSDSGSVRTWTATATFDSSYTWYVATGQTGTFLGSGSVSYPITFVVA